MFTYHIRNCNIEICMSTSNCAVNKKEHFENIVDALRFLDKISYSQEKHSNNKIVVKKYTAEINYKSGETSHYLNDRAFRELELKIKLGKGNREIAFVIEKDKDDIQIHELLDNGIINIYSFYTHQRITTFSPTPERIYALYYSIGEIPPSSLIEKSEDNFRKEYNLI